jgi:hypothetical protein
MRPLLGNISELLRTDLAFTVIEKFRLCLFILPPCCPPRGTFESGFGLEGTIVYFVRGQKRTVGRRGYSDPNFSDLYNI